MTDVVKVTMKKLIAMLALAAVMALGLTGCATTPGNSQPQITPEKLAKTAVLVKGTVRASLLLVIDKYGTNAQTYICLAGDAMSVALSSSDYTPGSLEKRLTKLPVKELQKTEAQLIVSTILTAYEIYYSDYVTGKINGNQVAATLLTALRDGAVGACSLAEGGTSP